MIIQNGVSMVQAGKTFRVFVSSTFSDLKEERNALQREVFPKLRELCAQHGCRFQAIDLRWGVSEEAGLDQQTMKICLEEIERSQRVSPKPNFIVLLGDRYGWRPLPYEIPADEFIEILKSVSANEEELLLWDEQQPEDKKGWYREDLNAIPPVYCLQPRTGNYVDYDNWDQVERKIHSILMEASAKTGLKGDDLAKYSASATEQEIVQGALEVENAEDHVFCFFRNIDNKSKEKIVNVAKSNLIARDYIDLNKSLDLDTEAQDLQKQLKGKLEEKLVKNTNNNLNIHKYSAEWTGNCVSTKHIKKLCNDIYNSLSSVILDEIKKMRKIDDLTKEIKDHVEFGEKQTKFFVGRNEILKEINNYLQTNDSSLLTIYGDSGSGKSALMAKAVEEARTNYPDAMIITRFVGATPASSDVRSLLESLCQQISRFYGMNESTVPTEYQKLVDELPIRLSLANDQKPLIIFLDGLDQLSNFENTLNLSWLPTYIPNNVHFITSTMLGECMDVLEHELSPNNIIELKTMHPEEGKNLLSLWLKDASRTLQEHQKTEILNKFSNNGLPLYLKLAFEEVKLWKSHSNFQETVLSSDINGIISELFKRLSSNSNHGNVLVSHSLSYIASSRHGLSEDEIIDILSKDENVLDDFKRRSFHTPPEEKLPVVLWSRLYFDLEPYLTEHNIGNLSLLNFYHRQLGEVVKKEYLTSKTEKHFHSKLADYFESKEFDNRKIEELPWQLDKAGLWEQLKNTITDISMFLELNEEDKKYELMKYWQDIGNRYNMTESYNNSLNKIESEEILPKYYTEVARFLQLNAFYDGAEDLYLKALEKSESHLGPMHPNTIQILNNLAMLHHDRFDYDGAEPLYRRALSIKEEIYGHKHPDTALGLNNLAELLRDKRDFVGAEILYRNALEINEEVFGLEHPKTATSINNLASLLKDKGNLNEAEPLFRKSLEIRERIFGWDHPEVAGSLNNLSILLKDKKDYINAEKLCKRALEINEKVLGPEHPKTAISLNNLAVLNHEKRNFTDAESFYRKALKINEKVLGLEHPSTASNLYGLAGVLYYKRDYDSAEPLIRQALEIYEKIYSPYHPYTIEIRSNLASLEKAKKSRWKLW
jgi:Tfp pilus assembly protein PilF